MPDGVEDFVVTRTGDDEYEIEMWGTRYRLHHTKKHVTLEALDMAGSSDAVERLAAYPSDTATSGSIWSRAGTTLDFTFTLRDAGRVVAASIEVGGELREFEAPRDRLPTALAAALADLEVPHMRHILRFTGELDSNADLQAALSPPGEVADFALSPTCQAICDAAGQPGVVVDIAGPAAIIVLQSACAGCLIQDIGL